MAATQNCNLFFVGGIFGAGKSTLCQSLSLTLPANHLKASELIRHTPLRGDLSGKITDQAAQNQDRLLLALGPYRTSWNSILLDGHFCLFGRDHEITRLPIEVFAKLQLNAMLIVEAPSDVVMDRIAKRDGAFLEQELLRRLALEEYEHASNISEALRVPLMSVSEMTDRKKITEFLAVNSRAP